MSNSRANKGVLVCFNKNKDGSLTLTLDDIINLNNESKEWSQNEFVTSKDYSEESLKALNFTEKELADFGYSIISRLHAFHKLDEL